MKTKYTLLLLILSSSCIANPLQKEKPYDFEVSKYWPQIIQVSEKMTHVDVDGKTTNLTPRATGIVQRVEGDLVIVDFGRFGIHKLPISDTNFEEKQMALRSGTEHKEAANLTAQIGNKLIRFIERRSKHIIYEDNLTTDYYLFLYINKLNSENAKILQFFDQKVPELKEGFPNLRLVAFFGHNKWYGYSMNAFNRIPIFIPHMRLSYAKALHQEPNHTPSFVLTDAEGKIIHRSDTLELSDITFERLRTLKGKKREALVSVERELEKALSKIDN